jgi:mannosylglucosylglycerate synthase
LRNSDYKIAENMKVAILHYSAPPVVGGVEAVITAHTRLLLKSGCQVSIVAGVGEKGGLPPSAEFVLIPEMDSRHPQVLQARLELEQGRLPTSFLEITAWLEARLTPVLRPMDCVIVHNLFTKHFNLSLTAALYRMLDEGVIRHCIAWCHDFTWTSPHSRSKVYPGQPWDLLRTYRPDVTYVVVSRYRQIELAALLGCPRKNIHVIYNGVDPAEILGLSDEGNALLDQLCLWKSDLVLLMPVRITQAKNIEFGMRVVAALKRRGLRPKLVVTGPPDPHDQTNIEYYQGLLSLRRQLEVESEMRFVVESGPEPGVPYTIGSSVVNDLFRVSDALFMPSHREGFGMPVLEAGLVGMPVFCTPIPAAEEIGGEDVISFSPERTPDEVADLILKWAETSPILHLRRRIRQNYTWQAIFDQDIQPLLSLREAS